MAAEVHCGGDAFRTGGQCRLVALGCHDAEGRDGRQQPWGGFGAHSLRDAQPWVLF
jgi:hypothetical protein